ncbi:MAG: hypothetical protein Q4F57_10325 [Weeksellaceae bacterium]|nr:hypothetical protein [Weeksellaceae bacterium]
MHKIAMIRDGADAVSLNEETRMSFEMLARNVFRKYAALFPEKQALPFTLKVSAIEAIYNQLNQQVRQADVTEIILELQSIVNACVIVDDRVSANDDVYMDLSKLDFAKLRQAYEKTPRKNELTFNLQQAIERKMEQMLKENPLRISFYERYKEIVDEYNKGKSMEDTLQAFQNLIEFFAQLSEEEQRVIRENLRNQESLAIFDLLVDGKELSDAEVKMVKEVAIKTLTALKSELLNINKWRESRQIQAQVKGKIYTELLYLPQEKYSDEEVGTRTSNVYQHIYTNYYGGGKSVYLQK